MQSDSDKPKLRISGIYLAQHRAVLSTFPRSWLKKYAKKPRMLVRVVVRHSRKFYEELRPFTVAAAEPGIIDVKERTRLFFCPPAFAMVPRPLRPDGKPRVARFCNFRRFCPHCWARAVACHGVEGPRSIRHRVMTALFPLGADTPRGATADFDLALVRRRFTVPYDGFELAERQRSLEAMLDDLRSEKATNYPEYAGQHLLPMRTQQRRAGWQGAFDVIVASPHPTQPAAWLVEHRRLVAMPAGRLQERKRSRKTFLVVRRPNRAAVDRMIGQLCAYPWSLLFQSPGSVDSYGRRPIDTVYPLPLDIAAYLRATANRRLWEGYGIFRNPRKTRTTKQNVSEGADLDGSCLAE